MSDRIPGGMNALMEQLQAAQGRLAQMEQSMGTRFFDGEAGGGKVQARVNGKMDLVSLKIAPEVVDPSDVGMLEDLVLTAVNRAITEARQGLAQEVSGGLLGGGIPGLF